MGTETDEHSTESMLFASISDADRLELLGHGRDVTYPPGAVIFSRADKGDTLLLIRHGRVEISVTSLSGRKSVLNQMGPGEAVGEIALLDGKCRSADACAATKVTGLLLHRRDVIGFLKERPDAMFGLVMELCCKVRNASEMFSAQSQTEAKARLARCLLRLSEKWGRAGEGGEIHITEPFSQSDLGEFSGLSRENANRRLRQWVDSGLISLNNEEIILLDPDALSELAEM